MPVGAQDSRAWRVQHFVCKSAKRQYSGILAENHTKGQSLFYDRLVHLADPSQAAPDQAYDREWGVRLLERLLECLRDEAVAEGNR